MQQNLTFNSLMSNKDDHNSSLPALEQVFDLSESKDNYFSLVYPQFISNAFFILTILKHPLFNELDHEDQLKFQKIHQDCSSEFFQFFSKILKSAAGKLAFEELLCENSPATPTVHSINSSPVASALFSGGSFNFMDLVQVAAHPLSTHVYATNLLKLLKTLMSQADKHPDDISIIRLCSGLSSALAENNDRVELLFKWIFYILFHKSYNESYNDLFTSDLSSIVFINESTNYEIYIFYKFVCNIVKETSRFEEVVLASLAEALLSNVHLLLTESLVDAENFVSFAGLFSSLIFLMSASGNSDESMQSFGKPCGHFKLIKETINWLTTCKEYLSKKEVIRKIEQSISFGR